MHNFFFFHFKGLIPCRVYLEYLSGVFFFFFLNLNLLKCIIFQNYLLTCDDTNILKITKNE